MLVNNDLFVGDQTMPRHPKRKAKPTNDLPFAQRVTCTVDAAVKHSGLGRSTIWEAMKDGRIEFINLEGRRLIKVPAFLKLLEG
jgi:hypothetical protein